MSVSVEAMAKDYQAYKDSWATVLGEEISCQGNWVTQKFLDVKGWQLMERHSMQKHLVNRHANVKLKL